MRGKLIIIEAGDGCGKATQAEALYTRLKQMGKTVHKIAFPDYESDSSALIKMYLNGAFGQHPGDVNAYAASVFYAVDRYASFKAKWKEYYDRGDIIIADRYTTSNMVHQAVKIEDDEEREKYLAWLWDLEFVKMALPVPDLVVFLEMAPEVSAALIDERARQAQADKDIHEQDRAYLAKCHRAYCGLAARYDWHTVHCTEHGKLKSIEAIHQEIYVALDRALEK